MAQENPVAWSVSSQKIGDGVYEVVFTANIPAPWHMYDLGPYDGGPNSTLFRFEPGEGLELDGGVYMVDKPVRKFDESFGMEVGHFTGKARFGQKVKLSGAGAVLPAEVEWSVCNINTNECLAPETKELKIVIGDPGAAVARQGAADGSGGEMSKAAATAPVAEGHTFWGIILNALLWGVLALITPCVFPMIPMTVSFFMKNEGTAARGRFMAMMYGIFIVALFTLPLVVITVVTLIVGGETVTADIFNWIATHWVPNVIFFAVFMIFAASFFGAFDISLPSWMVNKSDRNSERGGLTGVFFMALTLVLISFSCTGPIIGLALNKSVSGQFWEPMATMLVFSVTFALPFTLFAFFPSLMQKLPRSGGWLGSVKVVLGFVEVAFGFKFLSVADQTYHWGLLDREVYLAIWIATFTLMGLYLIGKIRFAHDGENRPIGVGRIMLAIVTFAFVVYMIPGMFGAPLKGLSGYLPPIHTQDFRLGATDGVVSIQGAQVPGVSTRKYADFLHLPHGLDGYFDLDEALVASREAGKPVFLDYTGHGCTNCREMDSKVLSDERILRVLREEYVVVALFSDDKTQLPETEWLTTDKGRVLKGLGKKNSYIVNSRYGINSQPAYVILDGEGRALLPSRSYNLDRDAFLEFLNAGVEKYKGL